MPFESGLFRGPSRETECGIGQTCAERCWKFLRWNARAGVIESKVETNVTRAGVNHPS
jgi:hypothetical protein